MIYNLKNKAQADKFLEQAKWLVESAAKAKHKVVDLRIVRKLRSKSQNSYLHLLFGLYGLEVGLTRNEVKEDFWKRDLCADIFIIEKKGVKVCRSSADLDTKEMTICIERLRNHSAEHACYLPEPNEDEKLAQLEVYLQQYGNAQYI